MLKDTSSSLRVCVGFFSCVRSRAAESDCEDAQLPAFQVCHDGRRNLLRGPVRAPICDALRPCTSLRQVLGEKIRVIRSYVAVNVYLSPDKLYSSNRRPFSTRDLEVAFLGCIEADRSNQVSVGKRLTSSWPQSSKFREILHACVKVKCLQKN